MSVDIRKMCNRLSQVLAPNPTGGMTAEALKLILELDGGSDALGTSVGNSILLPLVEVYIHAKNWPYQIDRKRGSTKIRGVVFKTPGLSELADALTNGVQDSPATAALIEELRSKHLSNDKNQ